MIGYNNNLLLKGTNTLLVKEFGKHFVTFFLQKPIRYKTIKSLKRFTLKNIQVDHAKKT